MKRWDHQQQGPIPYNHYNYNCVTVATRARKKIVFTSELRSILIRQTVICQMYVNTGAMMVCRDARGREKIVPLASQSLNHRSHYTIKLSLTLETPRLTHHRPRHFAHNYNQNNCS